MHLNFAFRADASTYFEIEVGNLLNLPYENVATLVGYGKTREECFLITKWIPGGDLETRIGDLTWEQVKRILKGVAYALHMVHRTANTCILDLKPANILSNETTDPILCDFGLATSSKTYIGVDCGTSTYRDLKPGVS
ncbi:lrr receptor-like serinethreonine-protein kinase rpk2 [Nicotiana attenuata]|uniref:Lrr receptor-like serinethreonine-protein kinase rpk2 n=1 Tax=Nicotiana attenuata TaxID=49451 RepID=A0A314KT09_NICAT|nr:lrr receptor-like serinethreonine-protein kinase rpk2 [Nicotiana attenuata]